MAFFCRYPLALIYNLSLLFHWASIGFAFLAHPLPPPSKAKTSWQKRLAKCLPSRSHCCWFPFYFSDPKSNHVVISLDAVLTKIFLHPKVTGCPPSPAESGTFTIGCAQSPVGCAGMVCVKVFMIHSYFYSIEEQSTSEGIAIFLGGGGRAQIVVAK